jgi:hypothetical protein
MDPRNRDPPAQNLGRTLGQLVDHKMALVAICRRCKHQHVLYPGALIERFGDDCPASRLRNLLRCRSCGARTANLYESAR